MIKGDIMAEKTTDELLNEIKQTGEIEEFLEKNSAEFSEKPLHKYINDLIDASGDSKADIIARSGLNRIYAYQILSGKRLPSRDKLIAFAFGLQLGLDDTDRLLKYAGYSPLYARSKRDAIIISVIDKHGNIFNVNEKLYDNGFRILTA